MSSLKDTLLQKYVFENSIYKTIKEKFDNLNSEYKKYLVFIIILFIVSITVSLVLKTVKFLMYGGILALVVFIGLKVYDYFK